LAFEFQGETHYSDISIYGRAIDRKKSDNDKKIISEANGITLIEIPFWWNFKEDSLIATILKFRPDIPLPTSNAHPISLTMPSNLQASLTGR
jgi:hypothetical protein